MSKLVSVIIPVYNVKKYLRECLHSVIHQTYKDLEIILVDDGSTDGSGAICEKYRTRIISASGRSSTGKCFFTRS